MLLQVVIELATLKCALSYFLLVLVRRYRVLSDRVTMPVLDRFRRFQVGAFLMFDLRVSDGCWPGRGRCEIVVLVCESGKSGGGDDHPSGRLVRHYGGFIETAYHVNREDVLSVLSLRSE